MVEQILAPIIITRSVITLVKRITMANGRRWLDEATPAPAILQEGDEKQQLEMAAAAPDEP